MTWRIPLADLNYDGAEEAAVLEVVRSGWLTMGAVTTRFEEEFAAFTGARHAIAVTNCTAALHMAYLALGIGPGDEVIVPSLTFVATANAVLYTGATPVFADVCGEHDFSVDPVAVEQLITPHTRAIAVVHYAGYACDMARIGAIARTHGLALVEDAAHAPGATLDGSYLGTIGEIGCFSFFSNKNLATGEGGMLTTDDDALAANLRLLRSHGMTSLTWDRHKGHAFSYDVTLPGFNYRMDELRAALGRVQLGKLAEGNERRQRLNARYVELFERRLPDVGVPYRTIRGRSAYHIRPVLLPATCDRALFMEAMKEAGIQTSIHYPPVHRFTHYGGGAGLSLPKTESIAAREVTLPLFPAMTERDVEIVVDAVGQALARSDRAVDSAHGG